jgi:hypothetical protein
VSLDVAQDEQTVKLLNDVKTRWERVDVAADRLLNNETSLTTLAKGLDSLNTGNSAILELAQQARDGIRGAEDLGVLEHQRDRTAGLAALRAADEQKESEQDERRAAHTPGAHDAHRASVAAARRKSWRRGGRPPAASPRRQPAARAATTPPDGLPTGRS